MSRIPRIDPVAPSGVALDRSSASRGDHLDRPAECARELFDGLQRNERGGRAVDADNDMTGPPRAVVGRTSQQDRASRIVHELRARIAEHDSEKPATPSAPKA